MLQDARFLAGMPASQVQPHLNKRHLPLAGCCLLVCALCTSMAVSTRHPEAKREEGGGGCNTMGRECVCVCG